MGGKLPWEHGSQGLALACVQWGTRRIHEPHESTHEGAVGRVLSRSFLEGLQVEDFQSGGSSQSPDHEKEDDKDRTGECTEDVRRE